MHVVAGGQGEQERKDYFLTEFTKAIELVRDPQGWANLREIERFLQQKDPHFPFSLLQSVGSRFARKEEYGQTFLRRVS